MTSGFSEFRPALIAALFLSLATTLHAQRTPSILGTWHFDLRQGDNKEGPRTVIVREDSSASYGEETARWRIVGDSLWLAIGGEWEVYGYRLRGTRMTLSGGDLTDPIIFDRTGPPTSRPANVAVPPDPKKRAM
ncbi:MAG: hypothetical protein ABI836_05425 [Gemmatimonadota bacterium]